MSLADPMLFDARAFWSDENVRMMGGEEIAVYIRLLCHQWEEGSIPDDPERLAIILSEGRRRYTPEDLVGRAEGGLQGGLQASLQAPLQGGLWRTLRFCFEEVEGSPGRLANPRLAEERGKWLRKKEAMSRGGRAGGKKSAASRAKSTDRSRSRGASSQASRGASSQASRGASRGASISFSVSSTEEEGEEQHHFGNGTDPRAQNDAAGLERVLEEFSASTGREVLPGDRSEAAQMLKAASARQIVAAIKLGVSRVDRPARCSMKYFRPLLDEVTEAGDDYAEYLEKRSAGEPAT